MFRQIYECKSVNKCNDNIVTHKCAFCGKMTTYNEDKQYLYEEQWNKNSCHMLKVNRPDVGSGLDGKNIEIPCCDECLESKIIKMASQDIQDLIYAEEIY